MPVTDYIYQEDTVQKKDFGLWLVNKMIAAGWEQVGSNPPPATGATTSLQFYVMKGKRASDNAPTYVAINDFRVRSNANQAYSMQLTIVPLLDYTPGTPGQVGTTTQGPNSLASYAAGGTSTGQSHNVHLVGTYNDAMYPLDTPITVRFCITPHNVTLICRVSPYYGRSGNYTFFGLPDILSKEKPSGATIMTGSHLATGANSSMIIADTPLNIPVGTQYTSLSGLSMSPPRSPDIHGNFPLMIVYGGDSTVGLRIRMPSTFFMPNGGLMDKDLIQVDNMTFEVLDPQYRMSGGFLSGYIVYRIS